MADPGPDRESGQTQRWDRVPEPGGTPLPGRPPVPPCRPDPSLGAPADAYGGDDEPGADAGAVRSRDPWWQALGRGAGELLVTTGLILLLFVVYEVYVTDLLNGRQQDQLAEQIREQWREVPRTPIADQVAPEVGQPLAVLHVPRLGADWNRVVLEGTNEDELSQGPGHYVGTALPGQIGNVALAGHRVGQGSPFLDADQLRPGDPIVVETADAWFVYRVLGDPDTGDYTADSGGVPGQQIVPPSDVSVIAPTPGATHASGAYLTLTTCHPKYSARQRLIVHAALDGTGISKADAPDGPLELEG
jgi:sortase (surface protein transpeptidase)